MPKSGLKFWLKGHFDDILEGRPLNELRHVLLPYMTKVALENIIYIVGPLMKNYASILMNDPVAIRESFSTKYMDELHKSTDYDFISPLIGKGILSASGDYWHRQRRICDLGFSNFIIKQSVETSAVVSNEAVLRMKKFKNKDGKIYITADVEAALIAADIMGHVVLKHKFNAVASTHVSEAPVYLAFKNVLRIFGFERLSFGILPNRELKENLSIIDNMVDDIVKREKAKSEKSETLLSHLIHSDYKGDKLTEPEIKNNMKTFMFAGQDTTSTALAWALYFLALYPEVQRKATEEVDKVLGRDSEKPVTYEMVKVDLVYINQIMKEILRIRPSAGFAKQTVKDVVLPGSDGKSYYIPKGVVLAYNPVFIQLNKKFWGEDAQEFNPDRWTSIDSGKDLSSIYFPFSQGHRSCIGMGFAKAEFVTVVAKLIQSFQIKLTPETEKQPPKVLMDITLGPESFTLELLERN